MPLLSIAMIVRNEEKNLERCLRSIANIPAEIVVVDTGSTDSTMEIAKKFTDKVYHQQWQNDFSLHRNKAVSKCTGDWVFQVDADEEVIWDTIENPEKHFADFLKAVPKTHNVVTIPLRDWRESTKRFSAEFDAVRIFRRGHAKYKRRVHNIIDFQGRAVSYSNFYIKHYGYDLTPDEEKAKANRTIPLLNACLEDDPNDHEIYYHLMTAHAAWLHDTDTAIKYGLEYISRKSKIGGEFNQTAYRLVSSFLLKKNDFQQAKKIINAGLAEWLHNVDLWYQTLYIAALEKDPISIARASQNYIQSVRMVKNERKDRIGHVFYHVDAESIASGLYYLSMSYLELGISELNNLKKTLKFCNEKMQEKLMGEIETNFKILKIEDIADKRTIILPREKDRKLVMAAAENHGNILIQ